MKISIRPFFILLLLPFAMQAQKTKLHAPAEIIKMMTDSKVSYGIEMLTEEIPPVDQSNNLNLNEVYRSKTANGFATKKYKESELLKVVNNKAEEYFAKNDYINARIFYKKALEADSTYFKNYTYIGQTYGIEGNVEEAIKWYKKAIELNYIDYMAHWFLADLYSDKKQYDLALNEVLIAHILNRNNPRIITAMKAIIQKNKKEYATWVFTPQCVIEKTDSGDVRVKMNTQWMGYANAKALWTFEPGFKESMGYEKDQQFIQPEEKDALLGLATMANADKEVKPSVEVAAAVKAIEKGFISEFIFYEIFLPKMPAIAYQLPNDFVLDIAKYIKEIRMK